MESLQRGSIENPLCSLMKMWCLFIDDSKGCGFLQHALIPDDEGE